jgi:hypothetical protein
MTTLAALIKSFFANTAFTLTAAILMLISGFFAFLAGRLLASLNLDSEIALFVQLGLFVLCYSVLAQLAASKSD